MADVDDDTLDAYGEVSESELAIGDRDFQEMVIAPTDWTISVLTDLLDRQIIDLAPNYQRRVAWTEDKMSKFIESLFLRLPVPQIVLAETRPGRFAVIDGKQRLNSIARFCADKKRPLRLRDCEYRHDLEGLTYEEMLTRDDLSDAVAAFQSHTVRTIVVKNWRSSELIYLLFLRLNQNSVPLSSQELRRALYPGEFMTWLDEKTTNSPGMRLIFTQVPDFRMRDMEVALRHLAFDMYGASYRGNLKKFLDGVTYDLTTNFRPRRAQIEDAWHRYEGAVSTTFEIFGENAYRVWQNERFQPARNRAVMDIMNYYFADPATAETAIPHAQALQGGFKDLCEHSAEFVRALQSSTKTEAATALRFEAWGNSLNSVIGVPIRQFPSDDYQVG
ncbi:MAG: DUF262 domain-containing protein [Rhizobium sp.]|nr:DUF262 domain-containing protein [Rhizobium sp.]